MMGVAPPVHRAAEGERGMALVITMLILTLITAMGLSAMMMANMDATVTGYHRSQRTGEIAVDGALELTMAMLFGDEPSLNLPIGIDDTWPGTGDIVYRDGDLDVTLNINYKLEDSINYNVIEGYPDEVVRYGQDYNYAGAQKLIGKQPVYTVSLVDNRTGTRAEADLISQLGFKTPAAIFPMGDTQILMRKNPWGTEEMIEITSGAGTPALATTLGPGSVLIQHAVSTSCTGTIVTDQPAGESWERCNYTDNAGATHDYARHQTAGTYLYEQLFTDAQITAATVPGNFNAAREMQFCLLGVGDRTADLNGAADINAAKLIFNFDQTDPAVVLYNYDMQGTTLEEMIGASFADFRGLADPVLSGDESVYDVAAGANVPGKNLSGMTFGTVAAPQIVFFEGNMDDDGNYTGDPTLTLVTTAGTQVQGYGILVINGDANIQGSINWTGLMLVRGDMVFKPYQGGSNNDRSDFTLATRWKGWIMIGKDLDLWTYWGGTIILGYTSAESTAIKGIISAAIPHKVLNWRKMYD
jgi:hypothetical protein